MKRKFDLGMELRVARTRARLTLEQLEALFEGHPTDTTLFNIENNRHKPRAGTLRVVEAFIKMTPQAVALQVKSLGIKPDGEREYPQVEQTLKRPVGL